MDSVAQLVKNLPATGDPGLIPGSGRSPGEGNDSHSRILVWEIPWTEGVWWASVPGVTRGGGHDLATK